MSSEHPARARLGRTLLAFVLAPAAPVLLFAAAASTLTRTQFVPFVLYGGAVSYLAAAIIGVPAYLLVTRWWHLRSWHVLTLSTVVGGVALAALEPSFQILLLVVGAVLGFLAGVTFWIFWRRNEQRVPPPD